jgi:hypothetical protein
MLIKRLQFNPGNIPVPPPIRPRLLASLTAPASPPPEILPTQERMPNAKFFGQPSSQRRGTAQPVPESRLFAARLSSMFRASKEAAPSFRPTSVLRDAGRCQIAANPSGAGAARRIRSSRHLYHTCCGRGRGSCRPPESAPPLPLPCLLRLAAPGAGGGSVW